MKTKEGIRKTKEIKNNKIKLKICALLKDDKSRTDSECATDLLYKIYLFQQISHNLGFNYVWRSVPISFSFLDFIRKNIKLLRTYQIDDTIVLDESTIYTIDTIKNIQKIRDPRLDSFEWLLGISTLDYILTDFQNKANNESLIEVLKDNQFDYLDYLPLMMYVVNKYIN